MVSINPQKYIDREEILKEHLRYEAETGDFVWIKRPYRTHVIVGSVAGTEHRLRKVLKVRGAMLLLHRVAWWFATKKWPVEEIDHINCNSMDNRICNLREATRAENCFNKRPYSRGGTGLKGAYLHPDGYWFGQIRFNHEQIHLGCFKTEAEAHAAYSEAAVRLHGDFARVA